MATEAPNLPLARDLAADGRESARRRVPILVLYSLPACPYCNEVRRTQLLPMLDDPLQAGRALIRQIDVNGAQPALGFDGKSTNHGELAKREGIQMAPVVALLDARGRNLVEPLRGMLLPDFYWAYLDEAIIRATAALRTGA